MCDLDSAGNTRLTGSWPHTVLRERSPELTPGYLSGNPFRPRTVCLTEGLFSLAIARLALRIWFPNWWPRRGQHRWVADMESSAAWHLASDCLGCRRFLNIDS